MSSHDHEHRHQVGVAPLPLRSAGSRATKSAVRELDRERSTESEGHLRSCLLRRRLHQLYGGVAAGGDFLHVGRIVADVNQAEASQEGVALGDNQDIVAAGEKCDAFAGNRAGCVAEKFSGNLERRRRGRQACGPTNGSTGFAASCAAAGFGRRRRGDENIAMGSGILKLPEACREARYGGAAPAHRGAEISNRRRERPSRRGHPPGRCLYNTTGRGRTPSPARR